MSFSQNRYLSTTALALCLFCGAAAAQNAGNEVWIGQTGGTNTIVIVQEGRSNSAGADNADLRLDQDGEFNSLAIDQYGWANKMGAIYFSSSLPTGVSQLGDHNDLAILQHNSNETGGNIVGAVRQQSGVSRSDLANALSITQNETNGLDGAAGHYVGVVEQINLEADSRANRADVIQAGGGFGNGNVVDQLFQHGTGNSFTVIQTGQSNRAIQLGQIGGDSLARIEQGGGELNLVEFAQQFGHRNMLTVLISGSRNVIQRIEQNNELLGDSTAGNRAVIAIAGEDNGGDGLGGIGEFLSAAALAVTGVAQGAILQIGDDNDTRITVVGGSENKFGTSQIGDGNGTILSIRTTGSQRAERNESAIFQYGIDNNLSHTVAGSDNIAAVRQEGQRNRAEIEQTGSENLVELLIDGMDSNGQALGFAGPASMTASSHALMPGRLVQTGLANTAIVRVDGAQNTFGSWQSGERNTVVATAAGVRNQMAVIQVGDRNTSLALQSGSGNSLGVTQY